MKKVKIGVLGAYRGTSMINYCKKADNAEIVAICDKWPKSLDAQKELAEEQGLNIAFYDNFEDFIKHDMDAIVLANYANEHAPFAIEAMKLGKHVFSEVLPVQTMKEAVELIEIVEKTGMLYAYGENYCYMPAPFEMKKLYKAGTIGEFEYGECEYIHNCEQIWPQITYGDKDHWRNNMYCTFYCTHSIGPIIHATGLRPVSVVGFEGTQRERNLRCGSRSGLYGIEMITLENGGIIKSVHGGLYNDSVWFCMYGSKGRMESARDLPDSDRFHKLFVEYNEYSGDYNNFKYLNYNPTHGMEDKIKDFGHGGSDFYSMWHFVEKIKGNPDADTIDVYEAMDMFLPGMFAYRSILDGGIPKEIPNLRDKATRELWRNDTTCTDPKVAGEMYIPPFSKGIIEIDEGVYDYIKELWAKQCAETENSHKSLARRHGGQRDGLKPAKTTKKKK